MEFDVVDVVDVTVSVIKREVLTFPIREHQDYVILLIFEVYVKTFKFGTLKLDSVKQATHITNATFLYETDLPPV